MIVEDIGQFFYTDPEMAPAMYEFFLSQIPDWMGTWLPSDQFRRTMQTCKDQVIVQRGNLRIISAGKIVFWSEAYIVPFYETTFSRDSTVRTLITPPFWQVYPSSELRKKYLIQHGVDEQERRSLKNDLNEILKSKKEEEGRDRRIIQFTTANNTITQR